MEEVRAFGQGKRRDESSVAPPPDGYSSLIYEVKRVSQVSATRKNFNVHERGRLRDKIRQLLSNFQLIGYFHCPQAVVNLVH